MKAETAGLAIIAMLASPAWAVSLGLDTQENYPGNAAAPNYDAGGYTSRQVGNDTILTPVTGAGRIVDTTRPSITVRQTGSQLRSLPPMPTGDDDADSRRRLDWLMNH